MVAGLRNLYELTGGSAWRTNDGWLTGEPCVNSWAGIKCCPEKRPVLDSNDRCWPESGASGSVPVLTADMAALPHYEGGCHSSNFTGTVLDEAKCVVVSLDLNTNGLVTAPSVAGSVLDHVCLTYLHSLNISNNIIGGQLVQDSMCFGHLERLDVSHNSLEGPLPAWLASVGTLAHICLSENKFEYHSDDEDIVDRCRIRSINCTGLAPESCDAFSDRALLPFDLFTCHKCDRSVGFALGLGIALIVLWVGLIVLYVVAIRALPNLSGWVSTSAIVLLWTSTFATIGELPLGFPRYTRTIMRTVTIQFLGVNYIRPECFSDLFTSTVVGVHAQAAWTILRLFTLCVLQFLPTVAVLFLRVLKTFKLFGTVTSQAFYTRDVEMGRRVVVKQDTRLDIHYLDLTATMSRQARARIETDMFRRSKHVRWMSEDQARPGDDAVTSVRPAEGRWFEVTLASGSVFRALKNEMKVMEISTANTADDLDFSVRVFEDRRIVRNRWIVRPAWMKVPQVIGEHVVTRVGGAGSPGTPAGSVAITRGGLEASLKNPQVEINAFKRTSSESRTRNLLVLRPAC